MKTPELVPDNLPEVLSGMLALLEPRFPVVSCESIPESGRWWFAQLDLSSGEVYRKSYLASPNMKPRCCIGILQLQCEDEVIWRVHDHAEGSPGHVWSLRKERLLDYCNGAEGREAEGWAELATMAGEIIQLQHWPEYKADISYTIYGEPPCLSKIGTHASESWLDGSSWRSSGNPGSLN
jgi:hypothetical protein